MLDKINPKTKIAIIGATGLVGRKMIEVLEERLPENFKFKEGNLLLVASERSVLRGREVTHTELSSGIQLMGLQQALLEKPDIVLMSAGSEVSLEWAPKFAEAGAYVIDNSSAWRMHNNIPLIVPNISKWDFKTEEKIIANPNCVAIMLATGIVPFLKNFGNIEHVSATVIQAVSGAGQKGIDAFNEEKDRMGKTSFTPFVGEIFSNIIPATKTEGGANFNDEEYKVMAELPKILGNKLKISTANYRGPILHGHSAHVRITLSDSIDMPEIIGMFQKAYNIVYSYNPIGPLDVIGKDYALVSNARQDYHDRYTIEFFITSDNLRMGAASNAVSIMGIVLKELSLRAR